MKYRENSLDFPVNGRKSPISHRFYDDLPVNGRLFRESLEALRSGIPDAEWLLKQIESEQGWLRFPPYFTNLIANLKIESYARAQMECSHSFFDTLSYRMNAAPYRGKIRHKSLWLAFSILDQARILDELPHSEILEMCDEAGVGGYENRIQSVKHLSNRLREYREFQKRGFVSTT